MMSMCGIAGIINPPGVRADPGLLRSMIARLHHRGPDDSAVYARNHIGLAHARLSIIDLACGRQPMHNESGTISIVFNGEIFNYLELRKALIAKGYRFRTQSDTEVLLHLYAAKGIKMINHLRGMFAFGMWDLEKGRLVLGRGLRPHAVDPAQVRTGLKMPASALEHDDAQRFCAEIVNRRQHALDQRAVIGVVDLRPVERDGGNPSVIEIPQHWVGRHGYPL